MTRFLDELLQQTPGQVIGISSLVDSLSDPTWKVCDLGRAVVTIPGGSIEHREGFARALAGKGVGGAPQVT
jgi:hypothetical protein